MGVALGGGQQVSAVLAQVSQTLRGAGITFVGQVVCGAGKVVDRGYGRAQVGWAQERGHRKVFIMGHWRGIAQDGLATHVAGRKKAN